MLPIFLQVNKEGQFKLTDFGISRISATGAKTKMMGTLSYMAPV
jgi:serine/threonine protein kinase